MWVCPFNKTCPDAACLQNVKPDFYRLWWSPFPDLSDPPIRDGPPVDLSEGLITNEIYFKAAGCVEAFRNQYNNGVIISLMSGK